MRRKTAMNPFRSSRRAILPARLGLYLIIPLACCQLLSRGASTQATGTLPFVAAIAAADPPAVIDPPTDAATTTTVSIDFADGFELHIAVTEVPKEATVLDVMRLAAKHPRAPKFEIIGEGDESFLASIDDLATANGKGWLYRVDGTLADRSIGAFVLEPGQDVQWRYGTF
jgi:hypothetical protein